MYLNNFSCRVLAVNSSDAHYIKEQSTHNGTYVEIAHGTQFKLQIRNNWNRRAQFDVKINGEKMGTFQMDARQSVSLDRSAFDDAIFTAYVDGSWQENVSSQSISNKDLAGLIEVEITPEFDFSKLTYTPDIYEPNVQPLYNSVNAVGASMDGLLENSTTINYESYTGAKGNFEVQNVNSSYTPRKRRISKGGAGGQSVSSYTHDNVTVGGSGNSNTKFKQGTHMFLDQDNVTTFKMRLVAPKRVQNSGVRPLKASSTPPRL